MPLRNSGQSQGLIARLNDWAAAVVYIALIPMGMPPEEIDDTRGPAFF